MWLLRRFTSRRKDEALIGDLYEMMALEYRQKPGVNVFALWFQVVRSFQAMLYENGLWRFIMLRNYLMTAVRSIRKFKGYAFINIIGLAVGLACCLFIFLYVNFERSYDRHHDDHERIFRIALTSRSAAGEDREPANTPLLAPHLKMHYPQVEEAARVTQWSGAVIVQERGAVRERYVRFADPEIFSVLTIPFISGSPAESLQEPGTAVLTKTMALKYFGDPNPIGRVIRVQNELNTKDYRITGVIEDSPQNTHFKYHMFLSMKSIEDNEHIHSGIFIVAITYIKLRSDVQPDAFEDQIRHLSHELILDVYEDSTVDHINVLQSIADIHLHSRLTWEMDTSGNPSYLIIFSSIGILILLIACINFMNLSTARAATRFNEVGIRKVTGATRNQLIWQFLCESILLSAIALLMAYGISILGLGSFNQLTGLDFDIGDLLSSRMLIFMSTLVLITGIMGGSYPAFFLSAFKPVVVLRGKVAMRGGRLRQCLAVIQFAISVALIISTMIVFRQIAFMKAQNLGFKKEQKLVLPVKHGAEFGDKYDLIKNEFLMHHRVLSGTASSSVPGKGMNVWWTFPAGEEQEKKQLVNCLLTDYDFFEEYGLELITGRCLTAEHRSDTVNGAILLNEAAVRAFGWQSPEEAIGKRIWEDSRVPVVGIMKDFHWRGLQRVIRPMTLMIWPQAFRYITLTIDTQDLDETMSHIKEVYREWFPDYPMESFFLETEFDNQYRFEEQIGRIFRIFTFLGISIACLGLYGMAAFMAERRTKEIGIRKVMGASESRLISMLIGDFTKWIVFANVFAWPLAWIAMRRWLMGFAFRINITVFPFLTSAFIALGIAMLTVGYQAVKAATADPVLCLRYE